MIIVTISVYMKGFMRFLDPIDVARISNIDDTSKIAEKTRKMPATALVAKSRRICKFTIFSMFSFCMTHLIHSS